MEIWIGISLLVVIIVAAFCLAERPWKKDWDCRLKGSTLPPPPRHKAYGCCDRESYVIRHYVNGIGSEAWIVGIKQHTPSGDYVDEFEIEDYRDAGISYDKYLPFYTINGVVGFSKKDDAEKAIYELVLEAKRKSWKIKEELS